MYKSTMKNPVCLHREVVEHHHGGDGDVDSFAAIYSNCRPCCAHNASFAFRQSK